MIFLTVGMERFPFDRLLKVVDEIVCSGKFADSVFAQIGHSTYIPECYEYSRFLPFEEMVETVRKAKIIISHAGVGTTLLCLTNGHIPLLVPRLAVNGEHIDNHQLEFAMRMEREGKVIVVHDGEALKEKLNNFEDFHSLFSSGHALKSESKLAEHLKELCRNE